MGLAGAMRHAERERGDPLYPLYSFRVSDTRYDVSRNDTDEYSAESLR